MKIRIGIADDEQLFLKSLSLLIEHFADFEVVLEAREGKGLLEMLLLTKPLPDIVLVDVNMKKGMGGAEAVKNISTLYPHIRCVALSAMDDDLNVVAMLKAGCCSYLVKDIHPTELQKALKEIHESGYYNADISQINYRRLIVHTAASQQIQITDKERIFLRLACSEMTYQQIAAEMHLSEKTIDGYRASLFEKLNAKSRTGMVLKSLKLQLVDV